MIYPIAQQIEELMASFVDPDTGEITATEEEMQKQLEDLQMDFNDKIVELRNQYINLTAEAEALKKEKMALAKRQTAADAAAERIKRFLAYLLHGEKFKSGVCSITYRKSDKLEIEDREKLLQWCKSEDMFLKEPELREGDIKTAIKNGAEIPFAHIEIKNNVQVK